MAALARPAFVPGTAGTGWVQMWMRDAPARVEIQCPTGRFPKKMPTALGRVDAVVDVGSKSLAKVEIPCTKPGYLRVRTVGESDVAVVALYPHTDAVLRMRHVQGIPPQARPTGHGWRVPSEWGWLPPARMGRPHGSIFTGVAQASIGDTVSVVGWSSHCLSGRVRWSVSFRPVEERVSKTASARQRGESSCSEDGTFSFTVEATHAGNLRVFIPWLGGTSVWVDEEVPPRPEANEWSAFSPMTEVVDLVLPPVDEPTLYEWEDASGRTGVFHYPGRKTTIHIERWSEPVVVRTHEQTADGRSRPVTQATFPPLGRRLRLQQSDREDVWRLTYDGEPVSRRWVWVARVRRSADFSGRLGICPSGAFAFYCDGTSVPDQADSVHALAQDRSAFLGFERMRTDRRGHLVLPRRGGEILVFLPGQAMWAGVRSGVPSL